METYLSKMKKSIKTSEIQTVQVNFSKLLKLLSENSNFWHI